MNSHRSNLTVSQLLGYLDQKHIDTVMTLHWLLTLINYMPCLSSLRKDVLDAFRTRAAKLCLPVKSSFVHPLATSSKNETVTTDLKDALGYLSPRHMYCVRCVVMSTYLANGGKVPILSLTRSHRFVRPAFALPTPHTLILFVARTSSPRSYRRLNV